MYFMYMQFIYQIFSPTFWIMIFGGVVTYDVIEKLIVVADYAVSRERRGKETAVANFKILSLNLPGGGTE